MDRETGGENRRRSGAAVTAAAAMVGVFVAGQQHTAASNSSDPAVTVFPVQRPETGSSGPLINDLVAGPDGALWFTWAVGSATTGGGLSGIGTVSTSGHVSTLAAPAGWNVIDLAAGDGSLWVTEAHGGGQYITQVSPGGDFGPSYAVAAGALRGIAWGPDGALWYAAGASGDACGLQGGFIGRMTTSGATTAFQLPGQSGDNGAEDIVPGPDGALWFDLPNNGAVGRITVSGTIDEFALPGAQAQCQFVSDQDLAAGPDGAMWVGANWSGGVRRVSADGTATAYPVSNLFSIAAGGGNLWYSTGFSGTVGRMSTSGQTTASWPLASAYPAGAPLITAGTDGKMWIGVQGAIEELDPTVPPAGPTPPGPAGNTGVGGREPSPSARAPSEGMPTPVPGFLNSASPSPSPVTGALASAQARPSSGATIGIVLGTLAAIALVGSGTAVILRRRHARIQARPTP